ncbi:MAG: universal stress protein [Oculatellaceae cyanobacterium Prado106]|jgi:nucleotide-binding universal stress UspA family protein|nr:universal stress protein [Oculatellaceae cyanobacterium Prado106]
MTVQKVLVALDRSPQAAIVFEQALSQLQPGGHLMILHSLRMELEPHMSPFLGIGTLADVDTYGMMKRIQQEKIQQELARSQEWLSEYEQRAIAQGIIVETDCRVGIPGNCICDLARSWSADMIVLGRRGHQGLTEVVLGSVSNYVLHHAPCSVLIVQGDIAAATSANPTDLQAVH